MKKIKRISELTIADSERKLLDDMRAAFAQHERVLLSHRVRRALAEKRARGLTTWKVL